MQQVSPEKISLRAYEIWEAEGRPDGKHEDHWHQAMTELAANGNGAETIDAPAKKPRRKVAAAPVAAEPAVTAPVPAKPKKTAAPKAAKAEVKSVKAATKSKKAN